MVETMKEDSLTLWVEMHWGITMDEAGDVEAVRVVFECLIPRRNKVLELDHPDVKEVRGRRWCEGEWLKFLKSLFKCSTAYDILLYNIMLHDPGRMS